jgi:hypothetical protein
MGQSNFPGYLQANKVKRLINISYPKVPRSRMGKDAKRYSEIDKTLHLEGMTQGVH